MVYNLLGDISLGRDDHMATPSNIALDNEESTQSNLPVAPEVKGPEMSYRKDNE